MSVLNHIKEYKDIVMFNDAGQAWKLPDNDRAELVKMIDDADRYRWHDLRKDPEDLPNKQGRYLVVLLNPNITDPNVSDIWVSDIWKTHALVYYSDLMQICNKKHWHNGLIGNGKYQNYDKEVIAWKEIEPF